MQLIRLGETTAALIEIPFTTVLAAAPQTRILAATLANTAIAVKSKQAGVTTAVTLSNAAGNWTTCDDTGAPGVRGYKPTASELVLGVQTLIFTGTNMEPREVPIMVVKDDPYRLTATFGAVIAGTLTTSSFTTDLTPTNVDQYKNLFIVFTSGANAGAIVKIASISTATGKLITLASGYTLPVAPSAADKFQLIQS